MRFSRWLILIAILSIVAYVGQSYIRRKQVLAKDTPTPPAPLGTGLRAVPMTGSTRRATGSIRA